MQNPSNVGWGDEGTPTTEPNHDEMLGFEDSPQPTALNVRQTAISPIYDYYEFDYFVRDENHGKYMTQATLVTMDSVLELIERKENQKIIEWTTRTVLQKIGVEDSKGHRKRCRQILYELWKKGRLLRKAAKKNNLEVVYCRIGVKLAEYCVPCEKCSFPVHVSNGVVRECIRCTGKPIRNGDPARICLT